MHEQDTGKKFHTKCALGANWLCSACMIASLDKVATVCVTHAQYTSYSETLLGCGGRRAERIGNIGVPGRQRVPSLAHSVAQGASNAGINGHAPALCGPENGKLEASPRSNQTIRHLKQTLTAPKQKLENGTLQVHGTRKEQFSVDIREVTTSPQIISKRLIPSSASV